MFLSILAVVLLLCLLWAAGAIYDELVALRADLRRYAVESDALDALDEIGTVGHRTVGAMVDVASRRWP